MHGMNPWHAVGTGTTAPFAARIPGIEAITPLPLSKAMEEAVEQQQDRAAEVRAHRAPVLSPSPASCTLPSTHYEIWEYCQSTSKVQP